MPDKRRYADRAEYNKRAVAKRRRRLREMAIAHKGGRCEVCGYSRSPRALGFHHRDPAQKEFGVSDRGLTRSWDRVRAEIEKCVLLCANCHMEVHDGVTQLPGATRVENEVNCWKPQRESRGQSAAKPVERRREGSETIPLRE